MTEEEWNACADPRPMLAFLHRKQSRRKQRLFACACCRLVWGRIPPAWKHAVEVSEAYADGIVSKDQFMAARHEAESTPLRRDDIDILDPDLASRACDIRGGSHICGFTSIRIARVGYGDKPKTDAQAAMLAKGCDLLRDIFLPFRKKASFRPLRDTWILPPVPQLAQSIYDERAFRRCPILADALEDRGCRDAEILGHLRGPGPHCRGCWAVDLVLGRE